MITPLLRRHVPCRMRSQTQQIAKNQLPIAGFTLSFLPASLLAFPPVSFLAFPPDSLLSFPPALSGNPEIAKNRHGRILEILPFGRTSGQALLCFSGRQRKAPPTLTLPLKGGGNREGLAVSKGTRRHAPRRMRSQAQQIAKNQLPIAGFTLSFPQVSLLSFPPALSGNPEIAKNRQFVDLKKVASMTEKEQSWKEQ